MSVIFSQRTPGRRWLSLWPLALFLLLMLVGGLWIWQAWPQVMLKSALWQRDVNQQLSALLNAVATHPERAGGSLLLLSFMYGVLHALGPGHGKVVIATWLATHPSKLKSSIVLTLAAALLQGLVAIGFGGGRADRIATSGQAAPSERFLAGKGELCVSWRAGHLAMLAGHKKVTRAAT